MFGWIRTLAASAALRNRAGHSLGSLSLLGEELDPLNQLGGRLGARALIYVVDGTGEDVLAELKAGKDAGTLLGLDEPKARPVLLHRLRRADAGFFLRLAFVWEAARHGTDPGGPDGPSWLGLFLTRVAEPAGAFDAEMVEEMLRLCGAPCDLLVRALLKVGGSPPELGPWIERLRNVGRLVERHPEVLRQALSRSQKPSVKTTALRILRDHGIDVAPFAEEIVDLAVTSPWAVRKATVKLLVLLGTDSRPLLEKKASAGTPGERHRAVLLLWELFHVEVEGFLHQRSQDESSDRIRGTLAEILSAEVETTPEKNVAAPTATLAPIEVDAPPAEEIRDHLRRMLCAWEREAGLRQKKLEERGVPWKRRQVFSDADADRIFETLGSFVYRGRAPRLQLQLPGHEDFDVQEPLEELLRSPGLKLVHFVRLMWVLGEIRFDRRTAATPFNALGPRFDPFATIYRRSHPPAFGLRELAAVLEALGADPRILGWTRLLAGRFHGPFLWEDDAVWPYFKDHLPTLEEALELRESEVEIRHLRPTLRRNAFAVLARMPTLPPHLADYLWDVALGSSKIDRPMAQAALASQADREVRAVKALRHSQQEVRGAAAEWLADLGDRSAIPALLRALAKERRELAKAAFLAALERLGEPVDRLLDREDLLQEARHGLGRGIPAALSWLGFERLPGVRWADDESEVAPEILHWLLVRAARLRNAEPGPLLRRQVARFVAGERYAYGQHVLEAWIRHDAEAGSSSRDRGVLSVAAACCGAAGAATVERYVRSVYPRRAAQSKALVRTLAWIDHPAALQALSAIAERFRTSGVGREAERSAELLAERHGWTPEELADRAVPNAGFAARDADGEPGIRLDCGGRELFAVLDTDLRIALTSADGAVVRSFPEPGSDDDGARVKEAARMLAAARREVKAVVRQQSERFYEILCAERSWSFAEWRAYLAEHPIVRHLCPCLVWAAWDEGGAEPRFLMTFRPRRDGNLTDALGRRLEAPAPASTVRLAYPLRIGEEAADLWRDHLRERGTKPLFSQLCESPFVLPESRRHELMATDFVGHMVGALKLRGEATRRGYVRGGSENRRIFYTYRKGFRTLGIDAVIEFSGNLLPEEDIPVAIKSLYFEPLKGDALGASSELGHRIPLGQVPPVLLAEAWNDLACLAALGWGFDPEWEHKVGW